MTPALACDHRLISAARATWAPGRGSRHGSAWISRSTAPRSSQCHDGSRSIAVDAVAVAVVGLQPRRVALGAAAVLLRLGRARHGAGVARAVDGPAAALALERLAQREVDLEEVRALERAGLVDDLVGLRSGGACPPAKPNRAGSSGSSVRRR